MRSRYETGNTRAITDFFKEQKDRHFTADEVIEHLSESGNGIAKSTAYRVISKLYESGEIRRFESQSSDCFVYQYADHHSDCDMHFHLKCTKCGRLMHMECEQLDHIRSHIEKEHGFIIGGESIINGICEKCSASKGAAK